MYALAEISVGDPDHDDIFHSRMSGKHLLDLGEIDVRAAANDQVICPPGHEQVAVIVNPSQIAHAREPVGRRCRPDPS